MNSKIRQLEDDLIKTLNSADVYVEVKRLVLINILNTVTRLSDVAIGEELNESLKNAEPILEKGEIDDAESTWIYF